MVVGELHGERIDVIQWSEDPGDLRGQCAFAGQVSNVLIDEDSHYATVVVPDDQLACHRQEGQNARLAARLTGGTSTSSRRASSRPMAGRCSP